MKTTPNRNDNPWATASALAMVIMATIFIGFLYAFTGCRTGKQTAASQSVATATQTAVAADTSRTLAKTDINALSATVGTDSRQTRIDIERDSAGRPAVILVNETSSSRSHTASGATVASGEQKTSMSHAKTDVKTETAARIEETRPDKTKDVSTVAKIIVAAVAFAFFFAIACLNTKKKE